MASRRWPTGGLRPGQSRRAERGHAGTGGLTHLSALLFLTRANVQATMVPYRGGAQALSDVLAGQIDLYSASVSEVIPYDHRQVIAAGGVQRHTAGPAAGPADHRRNLSGVCRRNLEWPVGPAGMPEAVLARLADEGRDIVADPAFRARLEELGITPYGEPPSAFGARASRLSGTCGNRCLRRRA